MPAFELQDLKNKVPIYFTSLKQIMTNYQILNVMIHCHLNK